MSADATGLPQVTVVVATHNRPEPLRRLVEALHEVDYPRASLEVLLVDDGSEPPAELHRNELGIRLLRQPNRGPASARNLGIRMASGQIVAMTDDDCAPHPDWVRQLAIAHTAQPTALLGGHTHNVLTGNACAVASQMLVDHLYDYLGRRSAANFFFTTSNIAADRIRLQALGGLDESFPLPAAEDRDLCDRWKMQGPLVYVAQAVVDHAHAMTLSGYMRQQFRYGRGARVLHDKRTARTERRRVEGLSFYLELFLRPFRKLPWLQALQASALLLVAQVSNVAGYFYEGG